MIQRKRQLLKPLGLLCLAGLLFTALGAGAAYYEYRTNRFAGWVGAVLADTNASRHTSGRVWKQLRSRAAVEAALGERAAPLPEPGGGLPEAVSLGRFDLNRIPEAGPASYVAIWQTPVDSEQRDLSEVIQSLRIFRQGLALLEAADLPDVRYRERVRQEIASLYRQTEGVDTALEEPVDALHPDALRAAVFEELARDITPRLEHAEREALTEAYRTGRIGQILLHRGLGVYHGEISYRDPDIPAITFHVDPAHLAEVLKIDLSDTAQ